MSAVPPHPMRQLQLPIVEVSLAERLEAILQCCDKVKRGSSLFDARGQQHAASIAQRDAVLERDKLT